VLSREYTLPASNGKVRKKSPGTASNAGGGCSRDLLGDHERSGLAISFSGNKS